VEHLSVSPANADAFGRTRISQPLTLFDSSHRYRDNNLWDSLLVGTGSTVGFVTTQGLINIGIGTTAGCSAIRETTKVFSYQPGKSLLVLNTFVPAHQKKIFVKELDILVQTMDCILRLMELLHIL
jgi:hypothetical protein